MKINKKNKSCRKKEKSDLGAAILFLAPNFIGFLIFTLIPMVFSLVMSLYDWPLTGTHTFVGLKNFITLFTKDILFFKVMKNTFVYVIAYVALNVVIALGMAVWITSLKKANQFFRSVFFLPMMVGIVSSTMIFKWILNDTGIVNTVLRFFGAEGFNWFGSTKTAMIAVVIVSIWQGFGYNMVIFISGLLSVPKSLTEAAKIDGANSIQIFFKITLPAMSPSVPFRYLIRHLYQQWEDLIMKQTRWYCTCITMHLNIRDWDTRLRLPGYYSSVCLLLQAF